MLELVHTDIYKNDELKHWGIIGMKWGIRRYQNPDGSLTSEGRERYGVKTVADTKSLSYSKDYLVLKQKKNRTDKENEKFKRLETGKKHFENSINDPDYWEKMKDNKTTEDLEYASKCYQDYLYSTNYGKGMATAETLMAIPVGLVGVAADVGAIYALQHLNSPIVVAGVGTHLGAIAGMRIGANIYEGKHKEELEKEMKKSGKSSSEYKFVKKVDNYKKDLEDYKNRTSARREKEKKERFWSNDSVYSAAKKANYQLSQDKAYAMVYSNPKYYLKNGKWSYNGKSYGSVDGLIEALIKNGEV